MHFKIEDTGIGIKEEDLPKLFEEFRRIEENRNRNIEGTGLGMSITVQLLKLMGSRLNVTSEYGKGSCFSFDLEQDIVDDTPIGNLSERIKNQEKEYVYKIGFTAPDTDILVVDDNAVNRKVIRNLLKDTLIRIDEADSGEQCLEKIIHKKYDLIFLDHMMPGIDGIETLHAFPQTKGNLNIDVPVVALTANAVTGAKEMYLQNGFTDFLTKPVVFKKLERIIKEYLPEEKIYEGIATINNENPDDSAQSDTNEKELRDLLENLPEINLEYALLHSNTVQDLYNTMVDFIDMIDAEAEALERYWTHISEEDNLRQYRVKVHSMKASAAIIGAIYLSGMATLKSLNSYSKHGADSKATYSRLRIH